MVGSLSYPAYMAQNSKRTPGNEKRTSESDVEANKDSGELFCCPQWRIQLVRSLISTLLSVVLLVGAIVSLLASADKAASRDIAVYLHICFYYWLFTNAVSAEISGRRLRLYFIQTEQKP